MNLKPAFHQIFSIILLLLIITGCNNGNIDNPEVQTIDISNLKQTGQRLRLSEIATDIEYVKLEITEESILDYNFWVQVSENYIIIYHYNMKQVLLFSRDGKYLRKIGRSGKGPSEYIKVAYFAIDDEEEIIILYDINTGRFLLYTIEGEYIRTIKQNPSRFIVSHNNNLVLFYPYFIAKENEFYQFLILDFEGNILHRNGKIQSYEQYRLPYRTNCLYNYKDYYSFWSSYNDTIFRIIDNIKVPAYNLNFGNKRIPYKELIDFRASINEWETILGRLIETDKSIFMTGKYEGDYQTIHFNKDNGLVTLNPQLCENDFDGGTTPNFSQLTNYGTMVDIVSVSTFKYIQNSEEFENREVKNQEKRKKLLKLINSLKEDDNPVIMIVHLK